MYIKSGYMKNSCFKMYVNMNIKYKAVIIYEWKNKIKR